MSKAEPEIITFGCRLNIYESEVIKQKLQDTDLEDTIIVNTCAVTKEAERQARQAIRRAKRENPHKKIIVTGCSAQINPKVYSDMLEVDRVLGNEEKLEKKSYDFEIGTEKVLVNDIMSIKETALHLVSSFESRVRAFLQVQNGCNHRCTFCIIPYGRGNSRSVAVGEIVTHVNKLVASGFNEVVFTGVDISDYGKDLPASPTLANMITRVLKLCPDLKRLRLSSIDVAEIDDELFELLVSEPRIMPHIHISLQAGDDMILKRMKRRHLRKDVVEFCNKIRLRRSDIAFGADIIAGFPTETDEMFENTLNLVSEVGLHYLHVFPYSEREGTPAAKMPSVPVHIRRERAAKLREAGESELKKFMQQAINTKQNILVEKNNIGRTENFLQVKLDKDYEMGSLVLADVIGIEGEYLICKT